MLIDLKKEDKEEEEKEKADQKNASQYMRNKKEAKDKQKLMEKKFRFENSMRELASQLSVLANEGGTLAKELQIVETLCFPMILERQLRIAEAHAKTFEWLFEEDKSKDHERELQTSMLSWLRAHDGIFWVSGKAGSGKLTLFSGQSKGQVFFASKSPF